VGVTGTVQITLPLAGVVDLEAFKAKLTKDLGKLEKEISSLEKRLNNPGFVKQAPETVILSTRELLEEAQKQAQIINDRLQRL
jgi:valyl-tRNA synthetase